MTFQGRDIWRITTPKGDVSYHRLYHWRSAARWRGLTWEAFAELDESAQAAYIAEYETALRLETLQAETRRKADARAARQARARASLRPRGGRTRRVR